MNVIVDTSVWSLLLRRDAVDTSNMFVKVLTQYLEKGFTIHLPGIVLQEILDGIKTIKQFELLCEYFEAFPLITMERIDFVEAARIKNNCRSRGVQAGNIDFLIAALAVNRKCPLLTADKDFNYIAAHCSLILVEV